MATSSILPQQQQNINIEPGRVTLRLTTVQVAQLTRACRRAQLVDTGDGGVDEARTWEMLLTTAALAAELEAGGIKQAQATEAALYVLNLVN